MRFYLYVEIDLHCSSICSAPDAEVTITEKTVSVKKEKVTMVGEQETRTVESSPTFGQTLMPVTDALEGETVKYVHIHILFIDCYGLIFKLF